MTNRMFDHVFLSAQQHRPLESCLHAPQVCHGKAAGGGSPKICLVISNFRLAPNFHVAACALDTHFRTDIYRLCVVHKTDVVH